MTDGKCESCGKDVDVLVPIRILCETNGGMEMQLRHYCPNCFMEMMDEWESPKGEKDEKS